MKQITKPLTRDEHVRYAKQIYIFRDALLAFVRRHKKTDRAVQQAWRVEREIERLKDVMDGAFCGQFPDNPRPADPEFMDSPYISSTICDRAREEFADGKDDL